MVVHQGKDVNTLSRWEDKNSSSWKLRDSIMLKEMRVHQVRKHEATKKILARLKTWKDSLGKN